MKMSIKKKVVTAITCTILTGTVVAHAERSNRQNERNDLNQQQSSVMDTHLLQCVLEQMANAFVQRSEQLHQGHSEVEGDIGLEVPFGNLSEPFSPNALRNEISRGDWLSYRITNGRDVPIRAIIIKNDYNVEQVNVEPGSYVVTRRYQQGYVSYSIRASRAR